MFLLSLIWEGDFSSFSFSEKKSRRTTKTKTIIIIENETKRIKLFIKKLLGTDVAVGDNPVKGEVTVGFGVG